MVIVRCLELFFNLNDTSGQLCLKELSDGQKVVDVLRDWKALKDLPKDHPAQNYRSQWDAMSIEDTYGFLLYHGRVIVPEATRKRVLALLHLEGIPCLMLE